MSCPISCPISIWASPSQRLAGMDQCPGHPAAIVDLTAVVAVRWCREVPDGKDPGLSKPGVCPKVGVDLRWDCKNTVMDRYGACTYMFIFCSQMRQKIIHNSSCHQKLSMMRRRRQNRDQQSVAQNSDHKCMRCCISRPFHNDPNLKFELVRSENWRWDINKIMPKPVWQEKRRGRTLCSSCSCQKSLGRRRSNAIWINKVSYWEPHDPVTKANKTYDVGILVQQCSMSSIVGCIELHTNH